MAIVLVDSFDCLILFEVFIVVVWFYFVQVEVDIVVMEVGLGGRLDVINVLEFCLFSIIIFLSWEYWQVLGLIVVYIVREKVGIFKVQRLVFLGNIFLEVQVVF